MIRERLDAEQWDSSLLNVLKIFFLSWLHLLTWTFNDRPGESKWKGHVSSVSVLSEEQHLSCRTDSSVCVSHCSLFLYFYSEQTAAAECHHSLSGARVLLWALEYVFFFGLIVCLDFDLVGFHVFGFWVSIFAIFCLCVSLPLLLITECKICIY